MLASPLAGWVSKQWPAEYYAKLAELVREQLHMPLVLNGAPGTVLDDAGLIACGEGALRLLRVQRAGKGAPVIVLNELFGPQGWAHWLDALSARHEVTLPEHPGFGESDDIDWLENIHDLAYFYLDLLDHLKLPELHLVGSSIGGWLAIWRTNSAKVRS